jgi:molybdenum cofactor biosynthesis enzyme MoaA
VRLQTLKREWTILHRREFDFLIFFVTGQCNARCQHCFYWQHLGAGHNGLAIEDVERLARSMPHFRTLLLSGGEPTLRTDLVDVIRPFREHNHIQYVSIPTNGLLSERIAELAGQLAQALPDVEVSFNLSLDGFAELHDRIRGVPSAFEHVKHTLQLLALQKQVCPNLRTTINSVILGDNCDQIVELAREVQRWGLVDGHFFEVVRGFPRDERLKIISPEVLWRVYGELLQIQESYIRQQGGSRKGWRRWWSYVAKLGGLIYQYRRQWEVFVGERRWDYPCLAGDVIAVVDYDGSMRVCELREASVSLPKHGFDFERARADAAFRSERQIAKTHTCDCTHVCFMVTSLHFDLFTRFVRVPLSYALYKWRGW